MLYGMKTASKMIGIGYVSLRKLIKEGKIKYVWLGKTKRITEDEIARIQKEGTERSVVNGK